MLRWLALVAMLGLAPTALANTTALLAKASRTPHYETARALAPRFLPTGDGRSFYLVWKPEGEEVKDWIVSLHGSHGFATDDLAAWAPYLESKQFGLISLQWWIGEGDDTTDYYTPEQVYAEIGAIMEKQGIKPGQAMLHGFSRASTNIYALAAMDVAGNNWFRLFVANAGGFMQGYPPNRSILDGVYGEEPFEGSHWVMVCGMKDPNPDRDGCPAMRAAAKRVDSMGGEVLDVLEDPSAGHGAFHNGPANVEAVLRQFIKGLAQ